MKAGIRRYSFTDVKLTEIVGNFVGFLRRDIVEIAVRGVTTVEVDAFEALGNAFEIFPPNGFYQADVSAEVQAKNAKRISSYKQVQLISGFFEQQWGLQSWQYKKLLIKDMTRFPEMKFITICRNVVAVANSELLNLAGIGITQADIDLLDTEAQLMEDKLHAVNDKESIRDDKTQERIKNGNALYAELQKYSKIGKLVWENASEAKYNDYIINPTVHSALGKVQNLVGIFVPAAGAEVNKIDLAWNAVAGADKYELFVSTMPIGIPPMQFAVLDETPNTTYQHAPLPTVPSDYYYKVRAVSATESGADSDVILVQAT